MWLLVGCSDPPPPEVPCDVTPAMLGATRIEACDPLPGSIVQVRADGRSHTVVLVDGQPVTERGGAAFADWLDRHGRSTDLATLVAAMRALEAFPPQFDARAVGFDMPALGRSGFTAEPFELVLVTGLAPEEIFLRATLRPAPWTWTIDRRTPETPWTEESRVPLRDGGTP